MKKMLWCLSVMLLENFYVNAQSDIQYTITTDIGILTVSKTADAKDMITISAACWNKMVDGTKFSTARLAGNIQNLCIEIANKREGRCEKGIGFSCSIFSCSVTAHTKPAMVNNRNRHCFISVIQGVSGSVKMIFNDEVDWSDLQNIPTCAAD